MNKLELFLGELYPQEFLTASNGDSLLFIGPKTNRIASICLYTANIKAQDSVEFQYNELISKPLYKESQAIARHLEIPYLTVICQSRGQSCGSPLFYVSEESGVLKNVSSDLLKHILLAYLHVENNNEPAKEINNHLNDYFHKWSRENLPSGENGVIKVDLDGLWINPSLSRRILVEVKRSNKPPIPEWRPYKSDYSGLEFLRNIAIKLGIPFWIIHHQNEDLTLSSTVSIFQVDTQVEFCSPLTFSQELNPIVLSDVIERINLTNP